MILYQVSFQFVIFFSPNNEDSYANKQTNNNNKTYTRDPFHCLKYTPYHRV